MERMGQQSSHTKWKLVSDQKSTWSESAHPGGEMTRWYRDQVLRVIIEAKTQKRAPIVQGLSMSSDHWKSQNQANQ
ncbi:hypothetical protein PO909_026286 [Leuciscus waleckii]